MNLPGILIDAILVAPDEPQTHLGPGYDLSLAGEIIGPRPAIPPEPGPTGIRRVIASRAADEVFPRASVNLGFGIPGGIPAILRERGLLDDVWLSVEQGMHNGQLLDGDLFGAARYPDALISSLDQFDF